MNEIEELVKLLRADDRQLSQTRALNSAILSFKFFRDMSIFKVIDFDILSAMLRDVGVE